MSYHTGRIWRTAALLACLAMGCDSEDSNDPGPEGGAGGELGGAGGALGGAGGETGGDGGEAGGAGGEVMISPACDDGDDNDGDGLIDLDDPGCESAEDRDETDPPPPPACDDGVDNDADGFTDFPEDIGCGSPLDDDEENAAPQPQCNDGLDNDQDGLVDELDPGCTSVADPREDDPEVSPQCSDELDNDDDGVIDFPYDLGCSAAGDDDETSPELPPACADGVDNDMDGFVDFPNDPGCVGVGDRDEASTGRAPDCADNRDNDNDGLVDYPEDPGCYAAGDYSEQGTCGADYNPPSLRDGASLTIDTSRGRFGTAGSCGGRGSPEVVLFYHLDRDVEALRISTDNPGTEAATTVYVRRQACLSEGAEIACQREQVSDAPGQTLTLEGLERGDYYIFLDGVDGRGGLVEISVDEIPLAQCLNQLDDDGDGLTDYPEDPGCERPADRDELDGMAQPLCADGADNDEDGLSDYPLDPGCLSASDDDEADVCGAGVRFQEIFLDPGFIEGSLADGASVARGSCGGVNQPELIYYFYNAFSARLTFSTDHPETLGSPLVYVRTECDRAGTELGCSEGSEESPKGEITVDLAPVGGYYVFVDDRFGGGEPFRLTVTAERLPAGCANGLDDDGDALIDGEDPGCESLEDEDELDPAPAIITACANGRDDDGDGQVDFPFDPGCVAVGDDDEADPEVLSQCADGLDNDEDGVIDFPADAGCGSRADTVEDDPRPVPQCANRLDDDQDGLTDYPFDPGCYAAGDRGEADPQILPACSNGVDDDRDGIADFPFDRGCESAGDNSEVDLEVDPICSNGLDDDEDGITDFPLDPGCRWAASEDEADPRFLPACGNGMDDDNDGRTDFPDDPGCRFAADSSEVNEGDLPPRCADGVDNDFDGLVDLRDIGCEDPEDDDEADPEGLPLCGNGVDDDEDDLTDWPDDPGCQAAGDLSEDQSCRPEVDTPLIPVNGTVLGATAEGDPDRYRSRCGGLSAPEAVYRYTLSEPATLIISADHPGTDYAPVISVRSDCEEGNTMLACAGHFSQPEPTVTLRDAQPGEYFIFVDGGGPEQWVSAGGPINLPADPRNYTARDDIQANGWSDAGSDAFDGYGRMNVSFNGAASGQLDVTLGQRNAQAGAYSFTVDSSKPHSNVWRVRLEPTVEYDERLVTFTLTGNLGSDGNTNVANLTTDFNGRSLPYIRTADGAIANGNANPNSDPPVHHMLVPSDPEQIEQITYDVDRDNVTITATDVKLPLTMYVALSYVAAAEPVTQAVLEDVELRAGPGGGDAPRFGNFELSVTEQPSE